MVQESTVKAPVQRVSKPKKPKAKEAFYGTGRRKEAKAKVWILPGRSGIDVNGRKLEVYFPLKTLVATVMQPLVSANRKDGFGIRVRVRGGGISGQAGAVRHGIARALVQWSGELRRTMREGGFLTRDPRMKERKKFGHKRARKSFQYSKR